MVDGVLAPPAGEEDTSLAANADRVAGTLGYVANEHIGSGHAPLSTDLEPAPLQVVNARSEVDRPLAGNVDAALVQTRLQRERGAARVVDRGEHGRRRRREGEADQRVRCVGRRDVVMDRGLNRSLSRDLRARPAPQVERTGLDVALAADDHRGGIGRGHGDHAGAAHTHAAVARVAECALAGGIEQEDANVGCRLRVHSDDERADGGVGVRVRCRQVHGRDTWRETRAAGMIGHDRHRTIDEVGGRRRVIDDGAGTAGGRDGDVRRRRDHRRRGVDYGDVDCGGGLIPMGVGSGEVDSGGADREDCAAGMIGRDGYVAVDEVAGRWHREGDDRPARAGGLDARDVGGSAGDDWRRGVADPDQERARARVVMRVGGAEVHGGGAQRECRAAGRSRNDNHRSIDEITRTRIEAHHGAGTAGRLGGDVGRGLTNGAEVSTTVTRNAVDAWFPWPSVAVKWTVVVPTGKVEPLG